MRLLHALALGMILMATAGCATPRYVTNWSQLQVGMTQEEVRGLLGSPDAVSVSSQPARVDVQFPASMPVCERVAGQWIAEEALKQLWDWSELWQYGGAAWLKIPILGPDEDAFGVFFDSDGKVMRYQPPRKGRYAAASQVHKLTDTDRTRAYEGVSCQE